MKEWKRWLVLALATVLCLSLCGCQELEDMRTAHAVWQEDGSILWNGAVYRELELSDSNQELDFTYDCITIYVTEPDVPVLLSEMIGDGMDICADGTLIKFYDYRNDYRYTLYCREDVYDEVVKKLENGVNLTTYLYYYWDYEKQTSVPYYLTEEQSKTIHQVLTTVIPVPSDEFPVEDELYLYICDDSHRFEQDTDKWLCIAESRYYISSYDEIYAVPLEYNAIFDAIWKAYNDSIYVVENPPGLII